MIEIIGDFDYKGLGADRKSKKMAANYQKICRKNEIDESVFYAKNKINRDINFIEKSKYKGMKILALDIATNTGWKTETASGVWNLKPNRGESEGMRIVRFKAKVRELITLESITLVSYERVAGFHKSSIIVASELVGVLKDLCIEMGIELACYSASEIKKFATGKGNADKKTMIAAAVALGYTPHDDNEADAIHLYNLTMKDLK